LPIYIRIKMTSFAEDIHIKHIAVIIAMEAEGKPLIEHLNLQKIQNITPFAPCVVYQGEFDGGKVSVVLAGKDHRYGTDCVGTTPASIATFVAVNDLRPDILISAGTAGGFKREGAVIGDCFIGSHFVHHDRRIPIPGFDAYGIGARDGILCPNLIKHYDYKKGAITTGNSLDHCDVDDKYMESSKAAIKEMEVASIAWVADLSQTPLFAVKVVTDIVDGDRPSHEEFLENLSLASKSLQNELPKILSFVMNKKCSEL